MPTDPPEKCCPNPNCPDRLLGRIPSAFNDEVILCPVCGMLLVPGPALTDVALIEPRSPLSAEAVVQSKPRVWPALGAFVLLLPLQLLVAILVTGAAVMVKYGAAGVRSENVRLVTTSSWFILTTAVAFAVLAAGLAFAGAWLSPTRWRERLQLRGVRVRISILVAGTVGLVALGTIADSLVNLGVVPHSRTIDTYYGMIRGFSTTWVGLAVLFVGLFPGVSEEMLFRGYIQTRLVARWGAAWGIAWTALLFGVAHVDPVQGAFAVLVGTVLGFVTARTGSIVPAMICHVANNSLSVVMVATTPDITSRAGNLGMLLVGAVALAIAVAHLRSHLPTDLGSPATSG